MRLLDHDPESGSLLLERLDADRTLTIVSDDLAALEILSELLARLSAVPRPPACAGFPTSPLTCSTEHHAP